MGLMKRILLLCICVPLWVHSDSCVTPSVDDEVEHACEKSCTSRNRSCRKRRPLVYYLYVTDFLSNLVNIPTGPYGPSVVDASYFAGRAVLYNTNNEPAGTCSASFLSIENAQNIFTNISNYISLGNGLIISWFTPTAPIKLELDSIVNSMVTECIVKATTKIGVNPFYGRTFNMIVSSDSGKIYFKLYEI